MNLSDLRPAAGSRTSRKRVGRGAGSGLGKTSGRGHKGQGSRSGGPKGPGFEGGQMPLQRRIPKRGFNNIFRVEYAVVNVRDLAAFEVGSVIDTHALKLAGLIKKDGLVKVLGQGEIEHALTLKVAAASKSAREKIERAGGRIETA
ncbi:MAG: 50S ribosomal protein L15 [Pseudomonadota bacterium]